MKVYKTLDLCSGIGGIRRGFELTNRTQNVLSCENDRFTISTYKHLYDEDPTGDITSSSFKETVKLVEYDILLAGFPCQAFSSVGKKEGFKDSTRGTIFFHIAEIIESTRPKAFLLENVEGLINHKKGQTFNIVLDTLINELNYKIVGIEKDNINNKFIFNRKDIVLNAKNFGLPQNRPRMYIVGFDNSKYKSSINNLNLQLPKSRKNKSIYEDLHDVLELKADKSYYLSQGYLETLKKHKKSQSSKGNGFGYMIVNDTNIVNPIANTILATGGSGKERNLVYDPQKNIAGTTVKGKQTPLNDECIRVMKPMEWAKLQGFLGYGFVNEGKEEFSFPENISKTQQYKQLGNSVAIPVIEEIAKMVIEVLDCIDKGEYFFKNK